MRYLLALLSMFALQAHAYTYGTFTPSFGNPAPTTTVYIAPRTDGLSGSGTSSDPFNANTSSKFDTLIQTYNNSSGTATVIYFATGTYTTMGWQPSNPQTANSNVYLIGSGIDQTIVKLDPSATLEVGGNGGIVIFACDYNERSDGFEVWNMTVDGNANNNTQFQGGTGIIGLIGCQGNDVMINNDKFVGWGTKGGECSTIFIQPSALAFSGDTFSHCHLQNCTFTSPATGNGDGCSIACVAADNTVTVVDWEILNNTFTNVSSDFSYSHALCGEYMSGNTVNGCEDGFYAEPGSGSGAGTNNVDPIIITGNTFENVQFGVAMNFHTNGLLGPVTVTNNNFQLVNSSSVFSAGINLQGATPTTNPAMTSITCIGNTFIGLGQGLTDPSYYRCVYLDGATAEIVGTVYIDNNLVNVNTNSSQEFEVTTTDVGALKFCSNTYHNGSSISVVAWTGSFIACYPEVPGALSTIKFQTPGAPGTLSTTKQ